MHHLYMDKNTNTELGILLQTALDLQPDEYLGELEWVRFTEADGTVGPRRMCRVLSHVSTGWSRMVVV